MLIYKFKVISYMYSGRSNSIGSGNAFVPLSAFTDPLLLRKCGDQHRSPHSTHFTLMSFKS